MNARDRLWHLYQHPDTASAFGDALDDFAHELAEKVRAEVGPREPEAEPEYSYGYNHGMHDAADLIDPKLS